MHEVEMANRVLKALRQISSDRKARIAEVNLRIGEINEPESLKLWLNKLGGDEFESTKFKIVRIPITVKCNNCGYSGPAKSLDTHLTDPKLGIPCPRCSQRNLTISTGQELEIVDVKIEPGR